MIARTFGRYHPRRLLGEVQERPVVAPPTNPIFHVVGVVLTAASFIASENGGNEAEIIGLKLAFLAAVLTLPRSLSGTIDAFDNWWLGSPLPRYQRAFSEWAWRLNKIGVLLVVCLVLPSMMLVSELSWFVEWHVLQPVFSRLLLAFFLSIPLMLADAYYSRRAGSGALNQAPPAMTIKQFQDECQEDQWVPVAAVVLFFSGTILQILGTAS